MSSTTTNPDALLESIEKVDASLFEDDMGDIMGVGLPDIGMESETDSLTEEERRRRRRLREDERRRRRLREDDRDRDRDRDSRDRVRDDELRLRRDIDADLGLPDELPDDNVSMDGGSPDDGMDMGDEFPPEDAGEVPPDDGGEIPATDTGEVPPDDGGGDVPPSDDGGMDTGVECPCGYCGEPDSEGNCPMCGKPLQVAHESAAPVSGSEVNGSEGGVDDVEHATLSPEADGVSSSNEPLPARPDGGPMENIARARKLILRVLAGESAFRVVASLTERKAVKKNKR